MLNLFNLFSNIFKSVLEYFSLAYHLSLQIIHLPYLINHLHNKFSLGCFIQFLFDLLICDTIFSIWLITRNIYPYIIHCAQLKEMERSTYSLFLCFLLLLLLCFISIIHVTFIDDISGHIFRIYNFLTFFMS